MDSPLTKVPGVQAKRAVVSSDCRRLHGDKKAVGLALDTIDKWPLERGATFHFVLRLIVTGKPGTFVSGLSIYSPSSHGACSPQSLHHMA